MTTTTATTVLSTFKIGIIGSSNGSTDQLYANGNQQIAAFIYVTKQVWNPNVNAFQTEPLTEAEKASLTIVQYSQSIDATLPPGWSCDTTKNQYDQGLRGSSYQAFQEAVEADAGVRADWETYTRYLRAGTSVPIQGYQFMARIRLDDGTVYTTHYAKGDIEFESDIEVTPKRPYVIQVAELTLNREDAYHTEVNKLPLDVDIYYWTLPSSLRILSEEYSGKATSNAKLVFAYLKDDDAKDKADLYLGAIIKLTTTSLTLGDIGNLPDGASAATSIPLNSSPSTMRALRYFLADHDVSAPYDKKVYWTITDNLGCRNRFSLKANGADHGNTLILAQD